VSEPGSFEILPHDSVGPVRFGMLPSEVHAAIGAPRRRARNGRGEWDELWGGIKVTYSKEDERAVEIHVMPPAEALLGGRDLLRADDPVSLLLSYDSQPLEAVGVVLFPKVGIAVTGLGSSADDSDKAVGVFARGRWDEGSLSHFHPLETG
jgi:hypothetical protein